VLFGTQAMSHAINRSARVFPLFPDGTKMWHRALPSQPECSRYTLQHRLYMLRNSTWKMTKNHFPVASRPTVARYTRTYHLRVPHVPHVAYAISKQGHRRLTHLYLVRHLYTHAIYILPYSSPSLRPDFDPAYGISFSILICRTFFLAETSWQHPDLLSLLATPRFAPSLYGISFLNSICHTYCLSSQSDLNFSSLAAWHFILQKQIAISR